ncbi:MAG: hypothetical protein MZV64_26750 [Ignavibacteriales bacterium]|nr:hypothetical protein [Ignavibacteriales bacterium]
MKKINSIFFILLIGFFSIITPVLAQEYNQPENVEFGHRQCKKVLSQEQNKLLQETLGGNQTIQLLEVKILSGEHKGKTIQIQNQLTSHPAYDIKVKEGTRVILDIENRDHNAFSSLQMLSGCLV